jgi:hypothetical protein
MLEKTVQIVFNERDTDSYFRLLLRTLETAAKAATEAQGKGKP